MAALRMMGGGVAGTLTDELHEEGCRPCLWWQGSESLALAVDGAERLFLAGLENVAAADSGTKIDLVEVVAVEIDDQIEPWRGVPK